MHLKTAPVSKQKEGGKIEGEEMEMLEECLCGLFFSQGTVNIFCGIFLRRKKIKRESPYWGLVIRGERGGTTEKATHQSLWPKILTILLERPVPW